MKIAYFDCFAGAGGDMIVASMLDAGLDAESLKAQLATLGIPDLDIKITQTRRCGIRGTRFEPLAPQQDTHRNLQQITTLINKSGISENAKQKAVAIFNKLASAEGRIHGKEPETVHFHEIGAVDSIVDIVSACVGLEALAVEKVYCSPLRLGGGMINCAHGPLPVPAPATLELLKDLPVVGGPQNIELLTPTAAAVLATVVDDFAPLPAMKIESVGYGAGSIESDSFPNLLRLIIGQSTASDAAETDSVCLLQANTDDTTGEAIGFVTETLLKNGALDVFTTPIYMKQNRPAVQISVICGIEDSCRLENLLFAQGVTFGIRKQLIQRTKLPRSFVTVQTPFGPIRMKVGTLNGEPITAKPEFSDCAAAAQKHNVAVKAVCDAAAGAFQNSRKENSP